MWHDEVPHFPPGRQIGYPCTHLFGASGSQNEVGVILHLKAKQTGLRLSLRGDAVVISMCR